MRRWLARARAACECGGAVLPLISSSRNCGASRIMRPRHYAFPGRDARRSARRSRPARAAARGAGGQCLRDPRRLSRIVMALLRSTPTRKPAMPGPIAAIHGSRPPGAVTGYRRLSRTGLRRRQSAASASPQIGWARRRDGFSAAAHARGRARSLAGVAGSIRERSPPRRSRPRPDPCPQRQRRGAGQRR